MQMICASDGEHIELTSIKSINYTLSHVSTQSRNGRLFTLNEIPPPPPPPKRVQSLFVFVCDCNSWMFSNLTPLPSKYAEMISKSGCYHGNTTSVFLMPTFLTDSAVCVYGS